MKVTAISRSRLLFLLKAFEAASTSGPERDAITELRLHVEGNLFHGPAGVVDGRSAANGGGCNERHQSDLVVQVTNVAALRWARGH